MVPLDDTPCFAVTSHVSLSSFTSQTYDHGSFFQPRILFWKGTSIKIKSHFCSYVQVTLPAVLSRIGYLMRVIQGVGKGRYCTWHLVRSERTNTDRLLILLQIRTVYRQLLWRGREEDDTCLYSFIPHKADGTEKCRDRGLWNFKKLPVILGDEVHGDPCVCACVLRNRAERGLGCRPGIPLSMHINLITAQHRRNPGLVFLRTWTPLSFSKRSFLSISPHTTSCTISSFSRSYSSSPLLLSSSFFTISSHLSVIPLSVLPL